MFLPFMLSHSFAQEVKGQTHYLLLSLPVSRTRVFSAKVAATVTIATVLFVISTSGLSVVAAELQNLAERYASVRVTFFTTLDLWVLLGMLYVSAMAVMLGIASGISGLKLVVRRFPGLAATAFAVCVLYFYLSTLPDMLALPPIFGTYEATVWIESTFGFGDDQCRRSAADRRQFQFRRLLTSGRTRDHGHGNVAVRETCRSLNSDLTHLS